MKLNIIYRRKRELRLVRLHFLSADGSRVALFPRERGGEKMGVGGIKLETD